MKGKTNSAINPARQEHARQRRRAADLWRHRVRQVARAEGDLTRLHAAGADSSSIAAAAATLATRQREAGMIAHAA